MFIGLLSRNNLPGVNRMRRFAYGSVLLPCLLGSLGCFNADAMIEDRRLIAMRARLEELDIGEFRVTLPRADAHNETAEIRFHAFAQVAHRDVEKVQQVLENFGPELRDQLIVSTRQLTSQQLEDPRLSDLRRQIAEVINESLEGELVQSVGFHRFGYLVF